MAKSRSKPASPVEHYENGQTVVLEYERTHTKTYRYKLNGNAETLKAAVDVVYIAKAALPDPAKPPKTIRIGVAFD
jgi:hypothetical protein